jgi:hypothetical protein
MDENAELTNLKKYLYELCQKIAGIKTLGVERDVRKAFFNKYKLYFLLFVHRISDYYEDEREGETLVGDDEIHLIKEINNPYKDKLQKSHKLIVAETFLNDFNTTNITERLNDLNNPTTEKKLKEKLEVLKKKGEQNKMKKQNEPELKRLEKDLEDFKKKNEAELKDFKRQNKNILKEIEDAHDVISKETKQTEKRRKEIDIAIKELISRILSDKKDKAIYILSDTQLNNILYGTTDNKADNRLRINIEIDKVRKIIEGSELLAYYSYINKIIHKINPQYSDSESDVKEYVDDFFIDDTKIYFGITKEEDLRIRKAFLIYLINNIIYYYIILKHDIGTPNCDAKIRYIFDNRYIKFSKIAMTAPMADYQYTTLNHDIIGIFKDYTYLFDLTNNIIEYERQYLLKCGDYNASINATATDVKKFENETMLKDYNDVSKEYSNAYVNYTQKLQEYTKVCEEYKANDDAFVKANAIYVKANDEYLKNRENKNKNKEKKSERDAALVEKNAAEKNKDEIEKMKETTGKDLRNAVYTFNELLFCCFCKYIEITFNRTIDAVTDIYKDKLSGYVELIKKYNETCKNCVITYDDAKHEEVLNMLTAQIKKVMNRQIYLLFEAKKKDGEIQSKKNAMNGIINAIIEIEREIRKIYKEIVDKPNVLLSDSFDTKSPSKDDEESLEYVVKQKDPSNLTYYQVMGLIIDNLKKVKGGYKNSDISSIYDALKAIVDKIKISELTFDALKTCCLDEDFMDEDAFIDKKDTGNKAISSIIYKKAIDKIDKFIETYKSDYDKSSTLETIEENAKKINAYLDLIRYIKSVETKARDEKEIMFALLAKAREEATAAYTLTETTNGNISKKEVQILNAIRIAKDALEREEELFGRYEKLQIQDIEHDLVSIRDTRLVEIADCNKNITDIDTKLTALKAFIKTIFVLANDAKKKAYLSVVYDDGVDVAIGVADAIDDAINKQGEEENIEGIKQRLSDANNIAVDVNKQNEEAIRQLEDIENLLIKISPPNIFLNGLSKHIKLIMNGEELNEIKGAVDNSVGVAIGIGEAIDDAENEEELNEIKGDVDGSVGVAISVGNAIDDAENEEELKELKEVVDSSVGVAIGVGEAIDDAENEEELKELKEVVDSSVGVAISVGNAIDDAVKQRDDDDALEVLKGDVDNSVGVAIGVGEAIDDAIKQREDDEELEVLKGDVDNSVGVAIDVGEAIDDAIKQQENDEELEVLKGDVDNSVGVAIGVGEAIDDAIKQREDDEELEVLKGDVDNSVGVAIGVGEAIDDAINKRENDEELEELKSDVDNSVGVAIGVGEAIPVSKRKATKPPSLKFKIDDTKPKPEPDNIQEQEPEPPVKVKRHIDEQYVKGNYLDPGLFKEVKDIDLKAIREYHAEQVRNKFRPKPGAIARMDAEIDKFNYPQTGGGSGDTGDMIKKINDFENDINNPIEAFEIKFEDRLVFIIATFFIRYVAVSIIQRGIDSNLVKTFYDGFIYYGVIYILLFWFIVLFINIDNNYTVDYIDVNNLAIYIRSVFYYFYMGTNGISRLAIHSLLILLIIIIPILLNIKNTKARDTLNEDDEDEVKLLSLEERTKLSKALSLFTLFIWILTSIIASKF